MWGYTDGIRRLRELRLQFDVSRVSETLCVNVRVPQRPRLFRNERLRHLAECLAAEFERPDQFSQLYVDSLTVAAGIDFLRLGPEDSARAVGCLAQWQLRRVTEYITKHLSEAVRLRDLARLTGLSQSQFGRAFKASTGFSPHRWQLNARIAKAQQLLLAGALPHAEIALATGFAEQSHSERHELAGAGIGEKDVEAPVAHLDRGEETVEILETGDIATDGGGVAPDLADCPVELGLSAARNDYGCTFERQALRCRESNAGAAACDEGDLSFVLCGVGFLSGHG